MYIPRLPNLVHLQGGGPGIHCGGNGFIRNFTRLALRLLHNLPQHAAMQVAGQRLLQQCEHRGQQIDGAGWNFRPNVLLEAGPMGNADRVQIIGGQRTV